MVQRFLPKETGHEVEVTRLLRMVSGYRLRLEVSYLGVITGGVCHHIARLLRLSLPRLASLAVLTDIPVRYELLSRSV